MQDCHWQSETKFGDVILPATTNFEHSDLSEWGAAGGYGFNDFNSNHRICIYQHKCIEPLWESKPDYEIYTLLAERLGFKEEYTEGHDFEDWNRIVFDKSDLPKYTTYEEFKKKGYFVVPSRPDDEEPKVSFRWFYEGRDADVPSEQRNPPNPPHNGPNLATPSPARWSSCPRPSWPSTRTTKNGRPWPATSPAGRATTPRVWWRSTRCR